MEAGGDPSWHQCMSLCTEEGLIDKGYDHSDQDHRKGMFESGRAVTSLDLSTRPISWGTDQRNPVAIAHLPEKQQ